MSFTDRVVTSVRNVLQGKFFYGWVIVAIAFFADLMSAGTGGYTLGLYFRPMQEELGWDRKTVTFALSVNRVVGGLSAPFIGWSLDRFGARSVMVLGAIIGSAGLASVAVAQEPWHFYLLYGVIGALGIAEFGNLANSAALSKWFVRKRGRAIAFATMGVSAGGVILIPLTSTMIEYVGWRMSWVLVGTLIFITVAIPTFLFMRSRPEDMGLLPDGDDPNAPPPARSPAAGAVARAPQAATEISWTLKEAVGTWAFWLLIPSFNLGSFGQSSILIHQIPYMEDKGFLTEAAWVGAIMAFFAMACKPFWGFLIERINARYCVMLSFTFSMLGLAALRFADNLPMLYLYAFVYGSSMGAMPVLNSVTWANYFGRTFIGTIRGVTMPVQVIFGAGSPLFAAWIADTLGSYDLAMTIFMGTYVLGAICVFMARQPVHPSQRPAAHPAATAS